jgi:hypothetical protein
VDALVWAITELMVQWMSSYAIYEIYRENAAGRPSRAAGNGDVDMTSSRPATRRATRIAEAASFEWVNTERALLPRPVDRMLDRCATENIRFAEISRDGRLPTPEEAAEHLNRIDDIRMGRA